VENGGGEGGGGETAEDMTCIVVMLSDVMDWAGAVGRDPTVVGGPECVGSQKDNVNSNFQASYAIPSSGPFPPVSIPSNRVC
jgi:hypothetical protein